MSISENEALQIKFRQEGYVYLPGFLSPEDVKDVLQHLDDLIAKKVPFMLPEQAFYENRQDPSTLKQIQEVYNYDDFFYSMMFGSRFEKLAAILLGEKVIGKNMQYFNKPSLTGQATPPHQDGYYFMLEPNEAVTMWLGLDDTDRENGCVRYVQGSHLKGVRPHGKTKTLGFSQGITDFGTKEDFLSEVWFNTKPGDLLVHHALTIHRAENNKSVTRSRRALGFIYYAENANENSVAKQNYQAKLAKEIRNKAK
jgi:hypothetical protein